MAARFCCARPTGALQSAAAPLAACFLDGRNQNQVDHSILEMLSQRVYGLALGYEDLNDHEQLRHDPVFGVLAGREELEQPLAGKSTLNRLELGAGEPDRYTRDAHGCLCCRSKAASRISSQKEPYRAINLFDRTADGRCIWWSSVRNSISRPSTPSGQGRGAADGEPILIQPGRA